MITDAKKTALTAFAEGRKLYKLMKFKEAQAAFSKALEAEPEDSPSKVYLERCIYYAENPPPEDWDGVFTMTTK